MRKTALAIGLGLILLVLAPSAQAAQTKYHPEPESRSFITSGGSWETVTTSGGSCVLVLTCPTVEAGFVSPGGAGGGGDGYLGVTLGPLLGVAGDSTVVFQSPPYVYNGFKGDVPDRLEFDIRREADLDSLLSVTGNDATITAELIDRDQGDLALNVLGPETLEGSPAWSSVPTVSIDPAQMTVGHAYSTRVTIRFEFGADVVPGSTAGIDDVVLTAEVDPVDENATCMGLIRGTGKADTIRGTRGADRIRSFKGNDRVTGVKGSDCIFGGSGKDRLSGVGGADDIHGNSGDDTVRGGKGKDSLFGGSGDDTVKGLVGNDTIKGNSGNDVLRGNKGRDTIVGGAGKDKISGGADNDRIMVKGLGKDTVNCGKGRDKVIADKKDKIAKNCERVRIK